VLDHFTASTRSNVKEMTSRNTAGFFTITMHTVLSVQKFLMKNINPVVPQPPYSHNLSPAETFSCSQN
jgi:hypothetical protein